MEELAEVLKSLKKDKALGPDGIKNGAILILDYVGELEILKLLNHCLTEKKVPQEWKDAFVASIYKGKGHDSDPANYRPIALLSTR